MSLTDDYKEQMRYLCEAQKEFFELNNKPHIQKNRNILLKLLSKFKNHPYNMHMELDKESGTVKLWASKYYYDHKMSPDLEVYVSGPKTTEVLMVNDDCIWRTISGLHESVQEAEAEEKYHERYGR